MPRLHWPSVAGGEQRKAQHRFPMAAKRSRSATHSATVRSRRSDKQRQIVAAALLRAVSVQGATNSAAARWLKISPRTMYAWTHCETPILVEIVLACPQLHDAFREALCVHEHESAPYIAKKVRR